MSKPKIFIGVTEVAGYFQNLFLGLKELNYTVGYLNVNSFRYDYSSYKEKNHPLLNALIEVAKKLHSSNKRSNFFFRLHYISLKIFVFIWCLFKYDVFIFGTCSSFFRYKDYFLLKLFNKKILHVSLGSDSRPSYINGAYKDDQNKENNLAYYFYSRNCEIKHNIELIEKYADVIVNYPQHAHFQDKIFINGNYIGFPTYFSSEIEQVKTNNSKVRILHAPTRPKAKGSLIFRKVIARLQEKGYTIEFIEITNKTNSEVIEEIKKSDIILDELYSDLPLGGLGAEAGYYARPVVVSGYCAESLKKLPPNYLPPSFYCLPSEIEAALEKLILDENYRIEKGKELHLFLKKRWSHLAIAQKYIQIISGDYPQAWEYDVRNLDYLFGWGVSKEEVQINIQKLIDSYGNEGLGLSHNPKLQEQYLSLLQR